MCLAVYGWLEFIICGCEENQTFFLFSENKERFLIVVIIRIYNELSIRVYTVYCITDYRNVLNIALTL